jgi:hypothetical protein
MASGAHRIVSRDFPEVAGEEIAAVIDQARALLSHP